MAIAFLPRLVLCVGPGGHHAIEQLNAICCHEPAPSTATLRGAGSNGDCAQKCTDTPLGGEPVLAASDSACRYNAVLPLFLTPVVTAPLTRWRAADFLTARLAPAEHPPRVLRTTVILC